MSRRGPWLVFVAAVAVLIAVMSGVTTRLLSLERERVAAEQRSAHEEQVRLALWQLDTEVAPLLSQEIAAVAALAQSPDATDRIPRPDVVRARFVLPEEGLLEILVARKDGSDQELRGLLGEVDLWAEAPPPPKGGVTGSRLDNPSASDDWLQESLRGSKLRSKTGSKSYFGSAQQSVRNVTELSNRAQAVDRNMAAYESSLTASTVAALEGSRDGSGPSPVSGGPARPMWLDDELLVMRQVMVGGQAQLHGSWIDWRVLQQQLYDEISDLLPHARLVPTANDPQADVQHLLATLPVRLEPGSPPDAQTDAWRALAPSLLLGWLGTLVAAIAVFAVLRWSLALSERRAAFVSAVTHELRTPLTTFRMYAEMLEEGMVDEAKRSRYISTLRREADRLGGLVENVLAYSRIESERAPLAVETLRIDRLLEHMRDRLEERAQTAELELNVELSDALCDAQVVVDPTAAEQILFNLVDNAAKYAPSRHEPRVELSVREAPRGRLAIAVRDHGPGIDPSEREAIFEPFAKARAHASGTKPGVGLGLALSRRLARQLGGDLRVEAADPGACFVLTLPRATKG